MYLETVTLPQKNDPTKYYTHHNWKRPTVEQKATIGM
jgi:hypothetical protein